MRYRLSLTLPLAGLLLLSTLFLTCHRGATTSSTEQTTVTDPQRPKRPSALGNGKFFTQDGREMLYGGQDADQHFDVTNSELEPKQFHYGIGREAFPALLEPTFTTVEAADAKWEDDDRFLVAFAGEEAKAYSIKDLTRHEIVNDELNGQPIMAAYCILADLGAIYERTYGDEELTFALSGYTYYDEEVWDGLDGFVFWDRETESLWWPLIGRAVSGQLKGVPLLEMDKTNWRDTNWEEVRTKFPYAQVMQSGLDFPRPAGWDREVDANKIVEQYGNGTVPGRATSPISRIDPSVIDSVHREIQEGKFGLVDHFLLVQNGRILADYAYEQDYESIMLENDTTNHQYNYDHTAWHPFYRNTKLHSLQSVTKSITSLLVGIAMDEGKIKSVDTRIKELLPGYEEYFDSPKKDSITLKDLLTMRSGLLWDEANYDEAHNSCVLMEDSDDWIDFVLQQPVMEPPGTRFNYNSGASVLLGKIVRAATGIRADRYAEEKLFGPLGITDYYWKITPKGEVDTEGGLYLTTHDLAKVGKLLLDGGKWEGRQVVSADWLKASARPWVEFDETAGYGFQWWVPRREGQQAQIIAGNGYGGQFLFVVPGEKLVAVFNGWQTHGRAEQSTWRVLPERLLK